jgi:hypothetical protein
LKFWLIFQLLTDPFIKLVVFGSIVVSISACHSQEQLAGGRGSIPRQRDILLPIIGQCFFDLRARRSRLVWVEAGIAYRPWIRTSARPCPSVNTDRTTLHPQANYLFKPDCNFVFVLFTWSSPVWCHIFLSGPCRCQRIVFVWRTFAPVGRPRRQKEADGSGKDHRTDA